MMTVLRIDINALFAFIGLPCSEAHWFGVSGSHANVFS